MKSKHAKFVSVEDRQAILTERRQLKMARSPHAYVRGNTVKFYEWLETSKGKSLPQGPAIWICGDCHTSNLGPIADTKGRIDIQIRDLDQTVIGNPAHDLIRLALSLASSARGSDLPGVTTVKMLEQMMQGYELAFTEHSKNAKNYLEEPDSVKNAMKSATKRSWKHLAQERIEGTKPAIPLGKRFWPLSKEEDNEVKRLFQSEEVHKLLTSLRCRDNDASVEVMDAAFWIKGCSSLGGLRIAVLLRVGNRAATDELCLIDIKEAVAASAPHYSLGEIPRDNAERVVAGAYHLAPFLGKRMLATGFLDHSVFMRELLPQDLKLDIGTMTRKEAIKASSFLAWVVGKAHAQQLDNSSRKKWLNELSHHHTKTLDAPSWLWTSVVELLISHEAAYLEHCRRYAMNK